MEPDRRHRLSARQREILLWSCRGKTFADIALITGLSTASVKTYLDQARYKLNAVSITQAAAVAVAKGIFAPEEILTPSPAQTSTPEPPQTQPSDPPPPTE